MAKDKYWDNVVAYVKTHMGNRTRGSIPFTKEDYLAAIRDAEAEGLI